jgi:uncharacterized protein with ParB-like and HNH nuclease domain
MKAGKYTIRELFVNRSVDQIVIPEIQRDYVWQPSHVKKLLNSIVADYRGFQGFYLDGSLSNLDESAEKAFFDYYRHLKCASNIGFIYAYTDTEYPGKYFLIDGQQRLTTIYLVLMVLAELDKTFRAVFRKLYFVENTAYLNYRVRESIHSFFPMAIEYYLSGKEDITDQSWYHNDYKSDKTVSTVLANVSFIRTYIKQHGLAEEGFIDYLQHYVDFWYFDTNISEQGEELYIYMNARGENMHSSENLKADLLAKIPDGGTSDLIKNNWGEKWEEWQDFFWKIRGSQENADKVFDEFVYAIAGLENYILELGIVKEYYKDKKKSDSILHEDLLRCFNDQGLERIEAYFLAVQFLCDQNNITSFISRYHIGTEWVGNMVNLIKQMLNANTTNWFANIGDENRGTEHNRMVFLWSLLYYTSYYKGQDKLDDVFRAARVFYNRYHNYDRSVKSIKIGCEELLSVGVFSANANNEEKLKYAWLSARAHQADLRITEGLIWQLENHPINLNGRDMGFVNSSHLIDYTHFDQTTRDLEMICIKFYDLFPFKPEGGPDWKNLNKIITILLFYGSFWFEKTTNNYTNLDFHSERRIVRDVNSKIKVFRTFFTDLLSSDLDTLYEQRVHPIELEVDTDVRLLQLRWYAGELKANMWTQGYFIAIGQNDHKTRDKFFSKTLRLVNTGGNFNGGSPQVLSRLVEKEVIT